MKQQRNISHQHHQYQVFTTLLVVVLCAWSISSAEIMNSQSKFWRNTFLRAEGNTPLRLQLALHQHNLDWLESTLYAVSNPTSLSYGKHLTVEQIAEHIAPPSSDVTLVLEWLSLHGIYGEVPRSGDWIIADITVRQMEILFECDLYYFEHISTSSMIIRCPTSYLIPSHLDHIISFVAGLNTFPFMRSPVRYSTEDAAKVDPSTCYSIYNVNSLPTSAVAGSSQAVVEFNNNYFSTSDLQSFFDKYQTSLKGQTVQQIYGYNDPTSRRISLEANLDVQYIMALGAFVNTSDYSSGIDIKGIMDAFLDYTWVVGNQTQPPLVQSISYGEYGGQYNNVTDQRINVEFQKMGVRGISILLASGDNGVGCGDDCQAEEYDFPSSPYLTMVGATEWDGTIETGATLSAGGFSNDFDMPSYQSSAVEGYLNSGVTLPPQEYNSSGRAYPDVAAAGMNVQIIHKGKDEAVDGTSCAAPIFAGIISLINNQRILQNKSPLGFLNPWLYSNPSMFNDITSGSNPYGCCKGFEATKGWDPVTGLGSPNYELMLQSAMSLP